MIVQKIGSAYAKDTPEAPERRRWGFLVQLYSEAARSSPAVKRTRPTLNGNCYAVPEDTHAKFEIPERDD